MTQKFFKGDLVQVGEMPESMRHFDGNCQAIVMYTYAEAYDRNTSRSEKQYCLHILNKGQSSWYFEEQLTLIAPDRFDLLPPYSVHRRVWEAKKERDA